MGTKQTGISPNKENNDRFVSAAIMTIEARELSCKGPPGGRIPKKVISVYIVYFCLE